MAGAGELGAVVADGAGEDGAAGAGAVDVGVGVAVAAGAAGAVAVGVAVAVGEGDVSAHAGAPAANDVRERTAAAIQAVLFIVVFNACLFMRQPPCCCSAGRPGDRELRSVYGRHAGRPGKLQESFGLGR